MPTEFAQFLDACGGVEAIRLAVQSGGGRPVAVGFDKPFVLVGRGPGADLQLADPTAASRQVYFQLLGGRLFGVHLADGAPTLRGGDEWFYGWVEPGDVFAVGKTRFKVLNPVQPAGGQVLVADPFAPDLASEPGYHLEPLWDEGRSAGLIPGRRPLLLIGQAEPTRLQIDHPSVAPIHAALVRTPAGPWVIDVSTAGVTVDGRPVVAAPVGHRSRVGIGEAELRVHLAAPLPPAIPAAGQTTADLVPVLEQFARLQQQTFDQVRELMAAMVQMVAAVMTDHREFVREEIARMEKLVAARSLATVPPPAPPTKPAAPRGVSDHTPLTNSLPTARPVPPQPAAAGVDVHAWLEEQLGSLERERTSVWQRLVQSIKGN